MESALALRLSIHLNKQRGLFAFPALIAIFTVKLNVKKLQVRRLQVV